MNQNPVPVTAFRSDLESVTMRLQQPDRGRLEGRGHRQHVRHVGQTGCTRPPVAQYSVIITAT